MSKSEGNSMCEYCDTSKYVRTCDGYLKNELAEGDYIKLSMIYDPKTNKFWLEASGDGEAIIDINFCPKCGRKL